MPRKGMSISVEAKDRIDELMDQVSAPEIHRLLERDVKAGVMVGPAPGLRSVQRYIAKRGARDQRIWSLGDCDMADARPILDALRSVIHYTEGRLTSLTVAEARMVEKVQRAAPELQPIEHWRLARMYLRRLADGEPADDVDVFLAVAPWRFGQEGWTRYTELVLHGTIVGVGWAIAESIRTGHPIFIDDHIDAEDRGSRRAAVEYQRMRGALYYEFKDVTEEAAARRSAEESTVAD